MPETRAPPKRKIAPRVLVVDDALFIRKVLAHDLGAAGFTVETADTAERALQSARNRPPDVVLADVYLGDGPSGLGLVRNLRTELDSPGPLIVLTSAHYAPDWLAIAREAGCDRFLVKPFPTELLVETIEQFIASRSAAHGG